MAIGVAKKKAKLSWVQVWEDKENGWELLCKGELGKSRELWFTLNSPRGKEKERRFYNIRTSPHSVEIRFTKPK